MRKILNLRKPNKKAIEQMKRLVLNPDFVNGIKVLQDEYRKLIDKVSIEYELLENFGLRLKLHELMASLDKHQGWEYFFAYYLAHDTVPKSFNPSLPYIDIIEGKKRSNYIIDEIQYELRIFPTTTKDDIEQAWGTIKSITNPSGSRIKTTPKMERDRMVIKLVKARRSYSYITKAIRENFKDDLDSVAIINIFNSYKRNPKK